MFNPANQTHFSLSLDGLRHDLQVLEFSGHEGISRRCWKRTLPPTRRPAR
ncbi:hypothetical protein, partial [Pseudomonas aeruginosa]